MDQIFAIVADGLVTRICELPAGMSPEDVYGAGAYIPAPRGVEPGSTYDGGVFGPRPAPPTPSVPVPVEVSNFQGHAALIAAGLDDKAAAVIAAIADATERKLAQLAYDRGAFRRDSALVARLAADPSINLTSAQVDDLFRQAAAIIV